MIENRYNLTQFPQPDKQPLIGIIMGSKTDAPKMLPASDFLGQMEIYHELKVVSAHRTPRWMYRYITTAQERGLKAIIAGAGGAAALPGMSASLTDLPVLGVPIETKAHKGMDSLLSIVEMPSDVDVATFGVDKAKNAAIHVARWLALFDSNVARLFGEYRKSFGDIEL